MLFQRFKGNLCSKPITHFNLELLMPLFDMHFGLQHSFKHSKLRFNVCNLRL